MKITEETYRYACNGCGRETPPVDELPEDWEGRIYRYTKYVHLCPDCIRREREPDYFAL